MIISKKDNNINIVYKAKNFNELCFALEEATDNYIQKLQVYNNKYYTPSVSKKYGRHPYGYFVITKKNKLTIFRKYEDKGYLYNSYKIDKIISFYLIRKSNKFVSPDRDYNQLAKGVLYKNEHWARIHSYIKQLDKEENEEIQNK